MRDHKDYMADQGFIHAQDQGERELASISAGVFNVHSPMSQERRRYAKQRMNSKEKIRHEEQEFMKRDFNPVNSLVRNDSNKRLIDRHSEALSKMHMLHKEAQERVGMKEPDVKYTVKSAETETINNNYAEM